MRAAANSRASAGTARSAAASGFSCASSSSPATARTASSISAICAGKTSRKSPETRKVTSTRGRPSFASGRIS